MREVLSDLRAMPLWEKAFCVAVVAETLFVGWFALNIIP